MNQPEDLRPHEVWIDGIDTETGEILVAKYTSDPTVSPFVQGSHTPKFLRDNIHAYQESQFYRFGQVISDKANPLTGLRIHVNRPELVPYFQGLAEKYLTSTGVSFRFVVG